MAPRDRAFASGSRVGLYLFRSGCFCLCPKDSCAAAGARKVSVAEPGSAVGAADLFPGLKLLVFSSSLFLFDKIGDEPRHAAAAHTTRRLGFRSIGISHVPEIKRLLCTDVVIVVKREFPTFTALKILGHGFSSICAKQMSVFGFPLSSCGRDRCRAGFRDGVPPPTT